MEEYVGQIWHKLVTRASIREYPEAEVELEQVKKELSLFFRALGGDGGLRITNSIDALNAEKRSFMQKIAGTAKTSEHAVRDDQTLQLPWTLAFFPEVRLNRNLYIWLAAMAATIVEPHSNWLERSRLQTVKLLTEWPGLRPMYDELVASHMQQRGELQAVPKECRLLEECIRSVLINPFQAPSPEHLSRRGKIWRNVPFWMHPNPPVSNDPVNAISELQNQDDVDPNKQDQESDDKRHKGESVENPDGRSGLLAFRLESMFSWTDYLRIDRTTDDEVEDNALEAANDMDVMSVAKDQQTLSSKLKLDLDLPSENHDDLRLGKGIPLPEWDYKKQGLQKDYCRLQNLRARNSIATEIPVHLRATARKLRRHFESLRCERVWLRQQNDGTEIDMDAYIAFQTNQAANCATSDEGLYRSLNKTRRDLSCLLLADLSLSTDTYVNNDARVIDLIRDSLFLFAEALSASHDRFAIHGFSSRRRDHIRFHRLKEFSEPYSPMVRGRIDAIKPGYYTRMGAAIRYSTKLLTAEASTQKLLLILTDGKPNDLDKYEGRYGIEDTREALSEARRLGLEPFCVTIDEKAQDYLPYLFGSNGYVRVKKLEELPRKLPMLYAKLTS